MKTYSQFLSESKLDDAKKFNDNWKKMVPKVYNNEEWSIVKRGSKWFVSDKTGSHLHWTLKGEFDSFDLARIAVNQFVFDNKS